MPSSFFSDVIYFSLKQSWKDITTWALIISNIITMILAFIEHWSFTETVWIYWCQIFIIGFFAFLKIYAATQIPSDEVLGWVNTTRVEYSSPLKIKLKFSCIFLLIYSIVFLILTYVIWRVLGPVTQISLNVLFIGSGIFFINHLYSFYYWRKRISEPPRTGLLVIQPFIRILPLFLAFFISGFIYAIEVTMGPVDLLVIPLIILFILKTIADVIAHALEHTLTVIVSSFEQALS